jgi:FAD/FMN-containing dehydrogenase
MLEMGISMFSFPWIMIMLKNYKKSRKYPRKWHCKFYFVDTFFLGHVGDGNFHILFLSKILPRSGRGQLVVHFNSLTDEFTIPKSHNKLLTNHMEFLGHVGDGNFHILFLADPNIPKELQQAKDLSTKVAE